MESDDIWGCCHLKAQLSWTSQVHAPWLAEPAVGCEHSWVVPWSVYAQPLQLNSLRVEPFTWQLRAAAEIPS